jgi:hypothetical protein
MEVVTDHLPERRRLRASDADRDAIVDVLRRHASVGRLDLEELGERIGRALSAKTYGDLDQLTADLPNDLPTPPPPRPTFWRSRLALTAVELLAFNVFFLVIWAVTSHGGAFWPGWILLVSAVLFVRRAVRHQLRRTRDVTEEGRTTG